MSRRRITVLEKVRARQLVDRTVHDTVNAVSKAVLRRWGLRIFAAGWAFGLLTGSLVWLLCR